MPHFGLNQVDVPKIVVLASRTTSGCELISVPVVTKTLGPYSVPQGDLAHVARWIPLHAHRFRDFLCQALLRCLSSSEPQSCHLTHGTEPVCPPGTSNTLLNRTRRTCHHQGRSHRQC